MELLLDARMLEVSTGYFDININSIIVRKCKLVYIRTKHEDFM